MSKVNLSRRGFLRGRTGPAAKVVTTSIDDRPAMARVTAKGGKPEIVAFGTGGIGKRGTTMDVKTEENFAVIDTGGPATAAAEPLPELNQALLDDASLEALFNDITACTRVLDVTLKMAGQRMTGQQRVTLEEAKALLKARAVRGAQVRYVYDGWEWWDTLMVTPAGVQVIRIRHG